MRRNRLLATTLAAMALAASCDGGAEWEPNAAAPDAGATGATLRGIVQMPSTFGGSPTQMAISAYTLEHIPPTLPPDEVFAVLRPPPALTTEPFPFELKDVKVRTTAPLYVTIQVYMPGGGLTAPKVGIDYLGHATKPVVIEGQGIYDVGVIQPKIWLGANP